MKDFGALLTGNTYLECDSLYTIILVCKETVTMLSCGREMKNDQDLALSKLNKLGGETRLLSMKLSLILLLMESERSLSQEITT